MLNRFSYLPVVICFLLGTSSCNEIGSKKSRGPIVMGDPATIVTETDSQYLQDMVLDYHPTPATAARKDTVATPAPDTTTAIAQQPVTANDAREEQPASKTEKVNGLEMDFGNAAIVITGISGKGSGTSYQLKSGSLNGKQIKPTEGTIDKVSQRYQTVVVVENNMGTLVLDNLSTTTGWQSMKGSGSYTISGLDERKLEAPKVTPASIKSAVSRATRKKRMSKRNEQKWLASVKNSPNANQEPLDVKLRSVMWKIEGKDSKGKPYSRQVRVDMPL